LNRRVFAPVLILILSSLACNFIMRPFLPPTPGPVAPPERGGDPYRFTPIPPPTGAPPSQVTPTPVQKTSPDIDPDDLAHPDRPQLSGEVRVVDTPHFRIHYTESGRDQVPPRDDNNNSIPDYVEQVAEALEYSWEVQINQLGWPAPPPDRGIGGDDRYDVYLEDLYDDGTAGYADGGYRETIVGDNPNTPGVVEEAASYSFISLDNDFAENDEWGTPGVSALDAMRVTAAHEFNHAIQYGFDALEPANWLWESTATWMESIVYDQINDGDYYLESVFRSPDICQIAEGGEERIEDEGHWYGMWIFIRYLSEQYGNDVVRAIWERAAFEDGYAALEPALIEAGTDLDQVFQGFAIALLTRDFEKGAAYPLVRLEGAVSAGERFEPESGVQQMAADFVQVYGQGPVAVRLDGLDDAVLVALRVGEGQAEVYPLQDGQVAVDASRYTHLYLIVLNLERVEQEYACRTTDYAVTVSPASQTDVPAQSLYVPNFRPPFLELFFEQE